MKTCNDCYWHTNGECFVAVPMIVQDNMEGFTLCRGVNPDRDASSCKRFEQRVEPEDRCPGCCNTGTVPGKRTSPHGLAPQVLCPVCLREGRIRCLGGNMWRVADGIDHDCVLRAIGQEHKMPDVPLDYSLAAGGEDE
jgi:hypothetical protein